MQYILDHWGRTVWLKSVTVVQCSEFCPPGMHYIRQDLILHFFISAYILNTFYGHQWDEMERKFQSK